MPFEPGNKYGGKREGAGRKSKKVVEVQKNVAEIAKQYIESNIDPVLSNYLRLAKGWLETRYSENGTEYDTFCYDGATTRHFINKVLPDEQVEAQRPITINFIKFDNTLQLHSSGVPGAILAGNGGAQESVHGVASQERQGQVGVKFLDFKDVS